MARIVYTVTATLPDEGTFRAYLEWLRGGHVDAVLEGGAHSGEIVVLEGGGEGSGWRVETRYVFATRGLFERYERERAPALRADGRARFGGRAGVSFERRVGELVSG